VANRMTACDDAGCIERHLGLVGVFRAGRFAEGGELRVEKLCGKGARESFDCIALLGAET
jgi:hypothetical protein